MEAVNDQSDHEVESALRVEEQEQRRINSFPSLGRQSSVYSLTLDEFQNTLTSDGKSFGSMNMDEFLKSIWTAEESEAQTQNPNTMVPTAEARTSLANMNPQYHFGATPNESSNIARQRSLTRQGSLSVPAPLCLKTVEEVWSEISKTQQSTNNIPCAGSKQREPTYGEMTLEDFLVKAGVVREEGAVSQVPPARPHPHPTPPQLHPHPTPPQLHPHPTPPQLHPHPAPPQLQPHPAPPQLQPHPAPPQLQSHPVPPQIQPHPALPQCQPHRAPPQLQPQPQPPPYGMYLNCDSTTASNYMIIGCGGTGSVGVPAPFKPQPQTGGGTVATCLPGGKSSAVGHQPAVSGYGGGVANGGCATESFGEMSPVSSDGMGTNKTGRKRIIDGPVERVIERRQKRMIKNRESAARSRARKHAYTIELEAELNQLKHENAYLRQRLAEAESRANQQQPEATKNNARKHPKAMEKLGPLRRSFSCSY